MNKFEVCVIKAYNAGFVCVWGRLDVSAAVGMSGKRKKKIACFAICWSKCLHIGGHAVRLLTFRFLARFLTFKAHFSGSKLQRPYPRPQAGSVH